VKAIFGTYSAAVLGRYGPPWLLHASGGMSLS